MCPVEIVARFKDWAQRLKETKKNIQIKFASRQLGVSCVSVE
jgi:hypothetical protein